MQKCTKPRILFILHLPPPVHGAAMVGQYIHDSAAVSAGFDGRFINLTTASGMGDIGKFKFRKISAFLRLLREIRRTVKEFRPELVYVTPNAKGGPFYKDFVVVQTLKRLGCQVLAHYHNKGVAARQDRPLDNCLYRRYFKDLKVLLLSERLYPDVQKYVRKENVLICPNGIPCSAEPVEKPARDVPELLFLSNLLIEKGVLVLLDSLRILQDRGVRFHCKLVGGETAELDAARLTDALHSRGLTEAVSYHGKRLGAEKEAFWADADIFVFPTFYQNECFPLVLLEAMAHGLPCVATDEGAIPDIVRDGETGLIVKKQDAADLADKLETLLLDATLRSRMGATARSIYEERFTLERFEKNFADCLKAATVEKN
jgi:glycosyltransferase involved in cell wall biosynthesis